MIGLLLIAHAPLAQALVDCAYHVYGCDPGHCAQTLALDVAPAETVDQLLPRAATLAAGLDSGAGVLVLTDLFGATPANLASQLARPGKVEVVCGVNLPMVMRALSYRSSMPLPLLVEKVMSGAAAGVIKIASNAPQNQQQTFADPGHASARMFDHQ